MTNKWQPIETAPKDGTHFIVFRPKAVPKRRVGEDYYMQDAEWKGILGKSRRDELPTHWMPFPNPPTPS